MIAQRKALLMGFGIQGKGALYDLLKYGEFDEIRILDNRVDLETILQNAEHSATKLVPIRSEVTDRIVLEKAMRDIDVVICLLPRDFALPMAEIAVEAGTNYACASYMGNFCFDEESRMRQKQRIEKLKHEARKKKLTVLTQFGLDPGLDLLLAGGAVRKFDRVNSFVSYGAGFPAPNVKDNPLHYKFTWTAEGVMRSYYRPARVIRDGAVVDIPKNEIFYDENIHKLSLEELGGVLECFPNGDAVALAEELGIKDQVKTMGRYVCRWEGHCAFWSVMANCGFLKEDLIQVNGMPVNRTMFLASVLSAEPQFFYKDDELDVSLTRVDVTGLQNEKSVREIYQIIDRKDIVTGFTSMTRTVGFVVSIGAMMILNNELDKGVLSPVDMPFEKTAQKLEQRDIFITRKKEEIH